MAPFSLQEGPPVSEGDRRLVARADCQALQVVWHLE
jgi:hypothetical protein